MSVGSLGNDGCRLTCLAHQEVDKQGKVVNEIYLLKTDDGGGEMILFECGGEHKKRKN